MMAKEINHWCVLCGKGYHACDFCDGTSTFTPWRSLTDTPEHFKIFTVLKDYNNHLISKKDARDLLSTMDLSDQNTFKDSSKKVLDEIFRENTVESKTVKRRRTKSKKTGADDTCNRENGTIK